ncbi:MAG: ATP synthase subunit C family protein [Pseudomonadota bacterium]|jgi:ATP synthase F0 subunit c|nr:F0F1 ATP synthase subunit C [Alphaproteobacteria bacterium]MEC7575836.1 ATP synthase subunit C family protein [Pseudomonadota bacterium]MCS5597296.1 ATP synthase subunit C family protein [Alphaproteobacteria bacterium]MEC7702624.1 ATP synthase subunit C family protein [Pseudomonadota bacterium]MEC9235784.1 ATP synthase subunit C family protein [Pseudomonadota bacterium]|tara:strand:- start:176 stop:403 length:228 start_codon:yes stop_codon:yes gene_type:complete
MELEAVKLLAGAIALLPLIGVGIGLGTIFGSYNEAVGRNPSAAEILDKKFFLTFALTEALAIFALLIAFYLVFAA